MLGTDAGVVEAGGDRVRVGDLAVLVGEHRRARAVEDAGATGAEARRAGGLDADEPHLLVVEEAGEHADRVRAAADAGDDASGSRPSAARTCSRDSRPITACSSRTISGYGSGPTHEPIR